MSITSFERNASIAEMAVEMDRRGAVIERLEAELIALRAENAALAADQCHAGYGDEHWHHRCREVDTLRAENARLREAVLDAAAHLAGAASAYSQFAGRHRSIGRGTADPFFTTRLKDFQNAADRARTALDPAPTASQAEARGEQ